MTEKSCNNHFKVIEDNYKRILHNVNESTVKYGREQGSVRIMAVTKTVPPEYINHALSLGVGLLGENRVQEFLGKADSYDNAEIHFIGGLQRNKVKQIIGKVKMIQSVDSIRLGEEIAAKSCAAGVVTDVLLEVNIGCEDSKHGFDCGELYSAVDVLSQTDGIRVCGLMVIPPIGEGEKNFFKLQQIFIDIQNKKRDNISKGLNWSVISAGMSDDYTEAIKYGSNIVRIGSALFGARK